MPLLCKDSLFPSINAKPELAVYMTTYKMNLAPGEGGFGVMGSGRHQHLLTGRPITALTGGRRSSVPSAHEIAGMFCRWLTLPMVYSNVEGSRLTAEQE